MILKKKDFFIYINILSIFELNLKFVEINLVRIFFLMSVIA